MKSKRIPASVIWYCILGALILVLGIVTCINSNSTDYQRAIIMTIGILTIIDASIRILGVVIKVFAARPIHSVDTDYASSLVAASELAVGIVLIIMANRLGSNSVVYAEIIFDYISLFGGVFFIVGGAAALLKGTFYLCKKYPPKDRNIFRIVGGAILVIAGILILALVYPASPTEVFHIFFMLLGVYLIVGAAALILYAIIAFMAYRKLSKLGDGEDSPVDSDTIDNDDKGE